MPDTPLSSLSNTFGSGYSTADELLLLDVLDTSMAATGTDKRITVAQFLAAYFAAGSNVTITPGSGGVTIASTASGGFTDPMTTTGDVIYCSASGSPGTAARLGIGSSGYLLSVSSGLPAWVAQSTLSITTSQVSNLGSWPGSSSITTVGAVAVGTWQATAIGVLYGGTGANLSATGGAANYVKQTTSGAALTVGTIAATDVPAVGSSGQLEYNSSSTRTGTSLLTIDSTPAVNFTPAAAPGSPVAGDLWYDSGRNTFGFLSAGLATQNGGIIWQGLSAGTAVANTGSQTSLLTGIGTTIGSLTIPANALQPGKILRPQFFGTISAGSGTPTIQFFFLLGGTVIWESTASVGLGTTSGQAWLTTQPCFFQVRSVGSGGAILGVAEVIIGDAATVTSVAGGSIGSLPANAWLAPAAITINTTGSLAFDCQCKWSAASASNTIQFTGGYLEILG